jgi:hypothetical protein
VLSEKTFLNEAGKQNNLKVSGSNKPKALNRMPRSTMHEEGEL